MNQLLELALELELMFTVQLANVNGDFEVELGKTSRIESPYQRRIRYVYKALSELIDEEIFPETKRPRYHYNTISQRQGEIRFFKMRDSVIKRQGRGPVDLIKVRKHVPADLRVITEIKEARAYVSEDDASLPAQKRVLVVPRQFGCLAFIGILSGIDYFLIAQIKTGDFNHVAEHWTLRGIVVLLVAILVFDVWRSFFRKDEP